MNLKIELNIKKTYDYISFQCESYYKYLNNNQKQNHYSLIESINLDSSYEYKDLIIKFDYSNTLINTKPIFINLLNGKSVIKDNIETNFDITKLNGLTESLFTDLMVTVVDNFENVLETKKYQILITPLNESNLIKNDYAMLACFVTPNLYKIKEIVTKANSRGFVGYLSNSIDSVREEMKKIYDSLVGYNIIYTTPLASFNLFQKIKIPSEVLTTHSGTCLDLAILYCSCLEYIGLNPILILIDNHAFVGCFLEDTHFITNECYDIGKVYNESSYGNVMIELVETTFITKGLSFNESTKSAFESLKFYDGNFYALDIRKSHKGIYRPIPVIENEFEEISLKLKINASNQSLDLKDTKDNSVFYDTFSKEDKFDYWSKKLLDLSLRNKLINFNINNNIIYIPSIENFTHNLFDDNSIYIKPVTKEGYTDDCYGIKLDEDSLRKLLRKGSSAIEETGANILYITIGLLGFKPKKSRKTFYGPVFLIPVRSKGRKSIHGYELVIESDELVINTTILEYLNHNYKIDINTNFDCSIENILKIYNLIRSKSSEDCSIIIEDDKVYLQTFSFFNNIMWNDIVNRKEDLLQNEVINCLVNNTSYQNKQTNEYDKELKIPLDADSSQIQAIKDCVNGKSFVLDGPPGTGKSQTIVNMIASSLYHGKTVLFVSEKMAALEVVKKRLDDIKLGSFCLELHSHKANKKDVIRQINNALENERTKAPDKIDIHYQEIINKEKELNNFITKTNNILYFTSLHEAIIKYHEYEKYELKNKDLLFLELKELDPILTTISNLKMICSKRGTYNSNPFYAFEINNYIFSSEEELKTKLISLNETVNKLIENKDLFTFLDEIKLIQSRPNLDTLYNIFELIYSNEVNIDNLYTDDILIQDPLSRKVIKRGLDNDSIETEFKTRFKETVFTIDSKNYQDLISKNKKLKKWFIIKKVLKALKRQSLNKKVKKIELDNILSKISLYKINKEFISLNISYLKTLFKNHTYNNYTELNKLYIETLNTKKLIDKITFKNIDLKIEFISKLNILNNNIKNFNITSFKVKNILNDFKELLDKENQLSNNYLYNYLELDINDTLYFKNYLEIINLMILNIKKIEDISSINKIITELNNFKINKELIRKFKKDLINYDDFDKYFLSNLYYNIINHYFMDSYFNEFNGLLFNQAITKYHLLLNDYKEMVIKDIASKVTKNFPLMHYEYAQSTEYYKFKKCLKSNGYKMTIRNMIKDFESIIRSITPCILMSPMSAALYLSLDSKKFDTVIFDEASQIPTSEAVGAISRGNSLIVAGDPEQMPPSNFFKASFNDEDYDAYEDLESLLDDCLVLGLPRNRLLWHYRSQHESLIAFSNNTFYNRSLYTFPSPDNKTSRVKFNYIKNGIYENGINKMEVDCIIREVEKIYKRPTLSKKSIGIITFNIKQQELILDRLSLLFDTFPEFSKINEENNEKIFVKNLENVQGDERDIVIFSVGFGYNLNKKFNMFFGPLSLDKGERRLNVAVTRAKEQMIVFSSIRSIDIDETKAKHQGAKVLKEFLNFSENGFETIVIENKLKQNKIIGLEKFIQKDLEKLGFQADINVGDSKFKIDLCIKVNDLYVLGVILDGHTYRSFDYCNDRNYVQIKMLDRLNWKVIRVYSLDYLKNKDAVINDIINAISKNQEKIVYEKKNIVFEKEVVIENKRAIEFKKYNNKKSYDYSYYTKDLPISTIIKELEKCIDYEGPINENLLFERFKEIVNVKKSGARVKRLFNLNLEKVNRTFIKDINSLVYYPLDKKEIDYYRITDLSQRDFDDIPSIEIVNALKDFLELQKAIEINDVIKILVNTFGYKKLSEQTDEKLNKIISYIIKNYSCFVFENDYLSLK